MSDSWEEEDELSPNTDFMDNFEDPWSLLDKAHEIVDRLRYYAWSRGLPFLLSNDSADGLIYFNLLL